MRMVATAEAPPSATRLTDEAGDADDSDDPHSLSPLS
jgi:hypothetical protein